MIDADRLHIRVGECVRMPEQLQIWSQFCVITAWNPGAQLLNLAINQQRQAKLEQILKATGLKYYSCSNAPDDPLWREESFLVCELATEALDKLAVQFGQLATLHWLRDQPVQLRWYADKLADSNLNISAA